MIVKAEYHPNKACATFHCDEIVNRGGYESWHYEEKEIWEVKQVINSAFGEEAIREPKRYYSPQLVQSLFAINGISEVALSRYEIRLMKGECFEWCNLEAKIIDTIKQNLDPVYNASKILGESNEQI